MRNYFNLIINIKKIIEWEIVAKPNIVEVLIIQICKKMVHLIIDLDHSIVELHQQEEMKKIRKIGRAHV